MPPKPLEPLPTTIRAGAANPVPGRDATGPSTTFAVSTGSRRGALRDAKRAPRCSSMRVLTWPSSLSERRRTKETLPLRTTALPRPMRCAAVPVPPSTTRTSGVCRISLAVTGPLPARLALPGAAPVRLIRTGAPLPGRSSSIVPAVTGARRVCRAGASPHGFAR